VKKSKSKEKPFFQEIKRALLLIITTIIIIALITFAFHLLKLSNSTYSYSLPIQEPYVSEVIDGDTFILSSGETVRLLCINAPEKDQEGYEEATFYLRYLILNQQVILESDQTDKDSYGRLLRYVYLNNSDKTFVNHLLVENGYSKIYRYGNDTRLCNEISSSN